MKYPIVFVLVLANLLVLHAHRQRIHHSLLHGSKVKLGCAGLAGCEICAGVTQDAQNCVWNGLLGCIQKNPHFDSDDITNYFISTATDCNAKPDVSSIVADDVKIYVDSVGTNYGNARQRAEFSVGVEAEFSAKLLAYDRITNKLVGSNPEPDQEEIIPHGDIKYDQTLTETANRDAANLPWLTLATDHYPFLESGKMLLYPIFELKTGLFPNPTIADVTILRKVFLSLKEVVSANPQTEMTINEVLINYNQKIKSAIESDYPLIVDQEKWKERLIIPVANEPIIEYIQPYRDEDNPKSKDPNPTAYVKLTTNPDTTIGYQVNYEIPLSVLGGGDNDAAYLDAFSVFKTVDFSIDLKVARRAAKLFLDVFSELLQSYADPVRANIHSVFTLYYYQCMFGVSDNYEREMTPVLDGWINKSTNKNFWQHLVKSDLDSVVRILPASESEVMRLIAAVYRTREGITKQLLVKLQEAIADLHPSLDVLFEAHPWIRRAPNPNIPNFVPYAFPINTAAILYGDSVKDSWEIEASLSDHPVDALYINGYLSIVVEARNGIFPGTFQADGDLAELVRQLSALTNPLGSPWELIPINDNSDTS